MTQGRATGIADPCAGSHQDADVERNVALAVLHVVDSLVHQSVTRMTCVDATHQWERRRPQFDSWPGCDADAAGLTGKSADNLCAATGFAEGAFDEVRMPDAVMMLGRNRR